MGTGRKRTESHGNALTPCLAALQCVQAPLGRSDRIAGAATGGDKGQERESRDAVTGGRERDGERDQQSPQRARQTSVGDGEGRPQRNSEESRLLDGALRGGGGGFERRNLNLRWFRRPRVVL